MKKNKLALGDELFKHKQGVMNGLNGAKAGFLDAGKHLLIIKQKKLYQAEGSHALSFAYWVENEIGLSRSNAYQLIDVYCTFGDLLLRPEYNNIDYSKAALLLPMVKKNTSLEEREELLRKADQPVRALKNELKERNGGLPTDGCCHPEDQQEMWNKCKACGKFWR